MTDPAKNGPHAVVWAPMKSASPIGSVKWDGVLRTVRAMGNSSQAALKVNIDTMARPGSDNGAISREITVSVPASDTQGSAPAGSPPSYNLTVSVQLPTPTGGTAPAALTMTVNVPLIAAPPPVPTGVVINQVS